MKTNQDTITLTGRTGNEPIVKTLSTNRMMARFAFATPGKKKSENGDKAGKAEWHNIVAWGKCAAMVQQQVKKGCKMSLTGKTTSRMIPTKNGEMREVKEVVLYHLRVYEPNTA